MIQSLLSRGPLSEKDLHAMFQDLTKRNPGFFLSPFFIFYFLVEKLYFYLFIYQQGLTQVVGLVSFIQVVQDWHPGWFLSMK